MKPGLCPDMPLLVNDWLSSTRIALLTPTEEGALIRLLCHAWNEPDCSLPDDDATLAKLSRLGRQWHKGSGAKIRAMFTPHPESKNRLQNPKQCKLRREQEARIKAASQHASNAANLSCGKAANSCAAALSRLDRPREARVGGEFGKAGNALSPALPRPGPGLFIALSVCRSISPILRSASSAVRSAYKRPARRLKLAA